MAAFASMAVPVVAAFLSEPTRTSAPMCGIQHQERKKTSITTGLGGDMGYELIAMDGAAAGWLGRVHPMRTSYELGCTPAMAITCCFSACFSLGPSRGVGEGRGVVLWTASRQ